MFETLFRNRNKSLTNLIKLGDCLGRSIRENVMLFSVDNEQVSYLTESNFIITGDYDSKDSTKITNITTANAEELYEQENFEKVIEDSIEGFLVGLREDDFLSAGDSFDSVLTLWEDRSNFSKIEKRLIEKTEALEDKESILAEDAIFRLFEMKDSLIEVLKEGKDSLSTIPEIENSVKLSYTISEAFDIPAQNISDLEGAEFQLKEEVTGSVYELICRQELVSKELLEAKKNFSDIWANGEIISGLVDYLVEEKDDESDLEDLIIEAIKEVPFVALASKKNLTEAFTKALQFKGIDIPTQDVKKFSSTIFEMKKPVRVEITKMLNNKYGVNVLNLQEDFSFKSLVQTQIVLLESLAKLVDSKSTLKQVLSESAKALKNKSGVEAIDLNDFIQYVFSEAGYQNIITENVGRYLNYSKLAGDLDNISSTLKLIMNKAAGADMGAQDVPVEAGAVDPSPADMGEQPGLNLEDDGYSEDPEMDVPQEVPGDAAGMEAEEQFAEMPEEDPQMSEVPVETSPEDLMGNLAELEDLISDLKVELGANDEEFVPGEEDELEEEPEMPVEDEGQEFEEEEELEDEDL